MTGETITGAEMARRMGVTSLAALIADAERRPSGPNRQQRRAANRKTKR